MLLCPFCRMYMYALLFLLRLCRTVLKPPAVMMVCFSSRSIRDVYEAEKLSSALVVLSAIWRLSRSTPQYQAPSRLCLVLLMSDCGTGHFIEFDDPLRLKWRSSSLRAKEILHRQQGNHKEITVPADFIVRLMYTKVVRSFID